MTPFPTQYVIVHISTSLSMNWQEKYPGGTQYKRSYGDVLPTWVAKSASWYMNDPIQNAKFGIWMDWFFKIFWNLIGSNLRKFWKNPVILLKIWPKIEQIGIYKWVTFSWKIGICMSLLQILRWHISTKTKLEYPQGKISGKAPSACASILIFFLWVLSSSIFKDNKIYVSVSLHHWCNFAGLKA